jgi:hypothetical protein
MENDRSIYFKKSYETINDINYINAINEKNQIKFNKILDNPNESSYLETLIESDILRYSDFESETKKMDPNKILSLFRDEILKPLPIMDQLMSIKALSNLPLFWQDYYSIFYLALKFIKENYGTNAEIIGLGESPFKFTFVQSLFYADPDIKQIMEANSYPQNLSFKEFPLSGLSRFAYLFTNRQHLRDYSLLQIIEILGQNVTPQYLDDFNKYFIAHKLDPKSIVTNNSRDSFIFVDRGENFYTSITLMYLYSKMIERMGLSTEEKKIFLTKFKLRTYDSSELMYNGDELPNTISRINQVINHLFGISEEENKHYNIMLHNVIDIDKTKIKELGDGHIHTNILIPIWKGLIKQYSQSITTQFITFSNLINFFCSFNKFVAFFSIPEQHYMKTRCIKSFNISPTFDLTIKHENISESGNCNLYNLILFIIFKKSKTKLSELIVNLNKIDETKLKFIDIKSFFPTPESVNLLFPLSSPENSGMIMNEIKQKILRTQGILFDTIFTGDTYNLPYKDEQSVVPSGVLTKYLKDEKEYHMKYLIYKKKYLEIKNLLANKL